MKKIIYLIMLTLTIMSTNVYGQVYTHSAYYGKPSDEVYYVDRRLAERRENLKKEPITAGVFTRFGYAFNYDAFTYGISMYYQWSRMFGITAGFDGYYIPNKYFYRTIQNDTISSNAFSMPLWNLRAGFMISKYFLFGAMLGKSNIGDNETLINMRQDAWFINNKESNFMYGGFVTFVLPISKWFGLNIDFAVTNKTGFNVGAGLNVTIPVKD